MMPRKPATDQKKNILEKGNFPDETFKSGGFICESYLRDFNHSNTNQSNINQSGLNLNRCHSFYTDTPDDPLIDMADPAWAEHDTKFYALKNVSLTIPKFSRCAIIGSSGSGKHHLFS